MTKSMCLRAKVLTALFPFLACLACGPREKPRYPLFDAMTRAIEPLGRDLSDLEPVLEALANRLVPLRDNPEAAHALFLSMIFDQRGIVFDNRPDDLENVLPRIVWQNRKGSCMGVAALMLLLSERARLPVFGVLLPGHLFLRWDQPGFRINIEPNRRGFAYSDDEYRDKYAVQDTSFYNLRNLAPEEVVSVLEYTLGTLFLRKKLPEKSVAFFHGAVERFPEFAEAHGNLAAAQAAMGKTDLARRTLLKARAIRPGLKGIDENLAKLGNSNPEVQ